MKEIARLVAFLGLILCGVGVLGCCIRTAITGEYSNGPVAPGYYPWMAIACGGVICVLVAGLIAEGSFASLVLGAVGAGILLAGYFLPSFPQWLGDNWECHHFFALR